ncbi:DNA sulfur modification protein DndB [Actinoplanes sp. NPDC089786]|uniref:DNA sulfur modification protein DndB n=1 Tax=Actinoplanes sp. NPDC089786 TaxID=3155185 RepID=UPI003441B7BC
MGTINAALMDIGNPLPGTVLDKHRFMTSMPVSRAVQLFLNPNVAENTRLLANQDSAIKEAAADREFVQRLARLTKAKKDNVSSYAAYIRGVVKGEINGSMPTVDAWVEQEVAVEDGYAYVPFRTKLIAFDGDTQLMALFRLYEQDLFPALADYKLPVTLFHNRSREWARQQLADRNLYGVKMAASTALVRDTRDPITNLAREVADKVGLTLGQGRQVGKNTDEHVTISAWRQAIAATVIGRSAAQLGTKPIDLPPRIDTDLLAREVTATWSVIVEAIRPHLEGDSRTDSVVSSPTVMFALGVLANHTLSDPKLRIEPRWTLTEIRAALADVEWRRMVFNAAGEERYPWEGITGKANREKGQFAVGGVKEYGYAAVEALEDPTSSRGQQIRVQRGGAPLRDGPEPAEQGVEIYADYEGHRVRARYLKPARVEIMDGPLAGKSFQTPTGAARAVVRHYNPTVTDNRNGWIFWQIENGAGSREPLQSIRPLGAEH